MQKKFSIRSYLVLLSVLNHRNITKIYQPLRVVLSCRRCFWNVHHYYYYFVRLRITTRSKYIFTKAYTICRVLYRTYNIIRKSQSRYKLVHTFNAVFSATRFFFCVRFGSNANWRNILFCFLNNNALYFHKSLRSAYKPIVSKNISILILWRRSNKCLKKNIFKCLYRNNSIS